MKPWRTAALVLVGLVGVKLELIADPSFTPTLQPLTNAEMLITAPLIPGFFWRLDSSPDLRTWNGLGLLGTNSPSTYIDSGAPYRPERFYRTLQIQETPVLLGDVVPTDAGDLVIHPVNHASFVMNWAGKIIYLDPVGGANRFQGLPRADVILVTHAHTDHFDAATLNAVKGANATLIVPPVVAQSLPSTLKPLATVLTNGASTSVLGFTVDAIPAYNITPANLSYHPKGVGNGYILTIGGRRIYISGDTEDTPELRALENIDVAFICMNLPYTMSVDKAVSAVRAVKPAVVYVYHYQGYTAADVNRFKASVGRDLGIEVRLRKWY